MSKQENVLFNQYYDSHLYTKDNVTADTSVHYLQYDKTTSSDATTVTSTLTVGALGNNTFKTISIVPSGAVDIPNCFWKRKRLFGTNVLLRVTVTHAGPSVPIVFSVLGGTIQISTSGSVLCTGSAVATTATLSGHTSTERLNIVLKVYGDIVNVVIQRADKTVTSLVYKSTSSAPVPIGLGYGLYTTLDAKAMKNAVKIDVIGSTLCSTTDFMLYFSYFYKDKNVILVNRCTSSHTFSYGIPLQVQAAIDTRISDGKNLVIYLAQLEHGATGDVPGLITSIGNLATTLQGNDIRVAATSLVYGDTDNCQKVNDYLVSSALTLIDTSSMLSDPSTGSLSAGYYTTGPVLTTTAVQIVIAALTMYLYDTLDSELYVDTIGASSVRGSGKRDTPGILQGPVVFRDKLSGIFQNNVLVEGNSSLTFGTLGTGLPVVSGTRPDSTRLVLNTTSTFDTAIGLDCTVPSAPVLWDSYVEKQSFSNGSLVERSSSLGHTFYRPLFVQDNDTSPSVSSSSGLKVVGDSMFNSKLFFTGSGNAAPSTGTRSLGTRIVLGPGLSGNSVEPSIGYSGKIWISSTGGVDFYSNATLYSSQGPSSSFSTGSYSVFPVNSSSETSLFLSSTVGPTDGYRQRVTTNNSLVFEKLTNGSPFELSRVTDIYGQGTVKVWLQSAFTVFGRSPSVQTVTAGAATSNYQCGKVSVSSSLFTGNSAPSYYTFTLNNTFIVPTSLVYLTIFNSQQNASLYTAQVTGVNSGVCTIQVSFVSGTFPTAPVVLQYFVT